MVINYAHRGASGYYPENTMIAFEKAISMNATGIETDIQMTKDGVLVLIHDEKVDRTTDKTGFVKDYTYKELSKLDAGSYFSKEFKRARIPTLEELLEFSRDKNICLDLELKSNIILYPDIEKNVVDMVYKYNMENKVIISSFNHYALVEVKKISKKVKIGLLYVAGLYHPEKYAKSLNAEAIHPYYFAVNNPKVVENVKKAKIIINPYTIDDEFYMKQFIDFGVNGIITNYPDELSKIISERL